jgi:hypothetical protein
MKRRPGEPVVDHVAARGHYQLYRVQCHRRRETDPDLSNLRAAHGGCAEPQAASHFHDLIDRSFVCLATVEAVRQR